MQSTYTTYKTTGHALIPCIIYHIYTYHAIIQITINHDILYINTYSLAQPGLESVGAPPLQCNNNYIL